MYLRQIELLGFRGINRLSMNLRADMVLIGENAWGKSSLLDALYLIFNPGQSSLYQFTAQDFHQHYIDGKVEQQRHISLLFCFAEGKAAGAHKNRAYAGLSVAHEDGSTRIYLRVSGDLAADEGVQTHYCFLDGKGEPLLQIDEAQIKAFIGQYPVFRFRDGRLKHRYHQPQLSPQTAEDPVAAEMRAASLLLHYYFVGQENYPQLVNEVKDTSLLWQQAQSLSQRLQQDSEGSLRKRLFAYLASQFALDKEKAAQGLRPIVLLEDPESRLHPRLLAIVWQLASFLPIQRITTTNSVELVSQVPLGAICRLVRYREKTQAFQLDSQLNKEELRRLSFHVHYNRSLALFSRTWILVEGETEVWILSELAALLNIQLDVEGIRIVEFAQSGLRPLIKYARAMGIEWYVLTDGDKAGQQYTALVSKLLDAGEAPSARITTLPERDIEHFFYRAGFEQVFLRLSNWVPYKNQYPISRIIQKAIQHSSKPDLAIALSQDIAERGVQSVPPLFKRLFAKVVSLSNKH